MDIKDVELLGGMEVLATCDPELQRLLERHNFQTLVEEVRRAIKAEDPEFIRGVSQRLQDLSQEIWDLAFENGVPFYAHNVTEMSRFLEKDPDASTQAENVYNLLGSITISLALGFLHKIALMYLARVTKNQSG